MRARRWMVATVGVVAEMALVACGSGATSSTGAGTAPPATAVSSSASATGAIRSPLPVVTSPAASHTVQPAVTGPPCHASQLRGRLHDGISEATGQNTGVLVLRNVSSRACVVRGWPRVALLSPAGAALPFRYRHGGDQMLTATAPRPVRVKPGAVAFVGVNKYRCDLGGRVATASVRLDLLGGGRLTVHRGSHRAALYPVLDYCGRGDPGSIVTVSPFEPTVRDLLAHH